ncbi:unnamed protein product [Parajaminaea phylloscopi]
MGSHGSAQESIQRAAPGQSGSNALWPQLTFTQGLLVGQLSIICVVIALIRYLLFEDVSTTQAAEEEASDDAESEHTAKRRQFPQSTSQSRSKQAVSSLLSLSLSSAHPRAKSPPPGNVGAAGVAGTGPSLSTLARIPDAVGYDMETASDIDVGWFNVLLAHVWEGYRDDFLAGGSDKPEASSFDAGMDGFGSQHAPSQSLPMEHTEPVQRSARDLMQEILNRPKEQEGKMSFLDPIEVTECLVGNSYPILSNARVRPRDDQGRVRIELDVDYSDLLSLSLRTAILINWPRERFAVLPTSLGLRITRFSGTLALSFSSRPPAETPLDNRSRHSLEVSLHPDFLLLATCSSLVGSRAKLQDIPKIQQLVLQRIRQAILDKFGWPNTWTVEMPDLVRRSMRRDALRDETVDGAYAEGYGDGAYMDNIAEEEGDGWAYEPMEGSGIDSRPPLTRDGDDYDDSAAGPSYRHFDAQRTPKAKQRSALGAVKSDGRAAGTGQMNGNRRMPNGQAAMQAPSTPSRGNSYLSGGLMAGGPLAGSGGVLGRGTPGPRPPYRPTPSSSQLTSISRRMPNPRRYTDGSEPRTHDNVHRGPRSVATGRARTGQSHNGRVPRGTPGSHEAVTTGMDPGVEAWRKEMVRRTHGGTPGPS